jgi:hypothetical protein
MIADEVRRSAGGYACGSAAADDRCSSVFFFFFLSRYGPRCLWGAGADRVHRWEKGPRGAEAGMADIWCLCA